MRELAADGITIVVSSHLLAEIEQVCSHVAIMSRGRLLRQGPLAELGEGATATVTVSTTPQSVPGAVRVLQTLGIRDIRAQSESVAGEIGAVEPEEVTAALVGATIPVRGLAVTRPSLEDLFVELTGEGFDVAR